MGCGGSTPVSEPLPIKTLPSFTVDDAVYVGPVDSTNRALVKTSQKYIYDVYTPGDVLGTGMSGDVREVTHNVTGKKYALKIVYKDKVSPDMVEKLRG